jgi:hypothetical protein
MHVVLNPMQCIMSVKQADSEENLKHRKHVEHCFSISSMVQKIKVLGYLSSLKSVLNF